MQIRKSEIEIDGKVEIITTDLELSVNDFDKLNKEYFAKLNFNLKITCEIDGVAIEPFYTKRLFELSKVDFNKLIKKGIISGAE